MKIDLGSVTAYSIAVKNGFQGTESEWMQAILNAGENAQDAAYSAQNASNSATASASSATSAEASALEAKVRYGSPLVAHLVSDMIDEGRVYVYVGDETGYTTGDWYYYDGSEWTSGGSYNAEGVNTDPTLSVEDMPADAKAVGDELTDIKQDLEDIQAEIEGIGSGLTPALKAALDQLAQKVAYIDEDGQDYYDALHSALYPPVDLTRISCVYTQSGTVYNTDTLDSLKSDLVVTAHYSNGTTETVTTYTLSGTLTVGTSTITVSYGGKTTSFTVTVTQEPLVPAEYQQVAYIQSDGTQLILTDIVPRDTRTIVQFEFIDFRASKDNFITGVYNTGNMRYYPAWIDSSGNLMFKRRDNSLTDAWTGPNKPTGVHTIDFNNSSHEASYDGEVKTTSQFFAITSGDGKIGIFSRGDGTDQVSIARIYSLKYENNSTGETIGEFIPCYRKADNVIGMYDRVTETFYTDHLGGNPFTKGADV